MNLDIHYVCFPGEYASETLCETLQRGFETNWTTTIDGGMGTCAYTDLDANQYLERVQTESAVESLATRQNGGIVIFDRDSDVDFEFNVRRDWSAVGLPELDGVMLNWHRVHSYDEPEQTTTVLFDAARLVYDILKPPFAFSRLARVADRETSVTAADIETERIPDVYWMMFISEPICERIGRDRIHSAPAWKTEPLSDGGVGLVATANPYQYTEADKMRLKTALGLDK